jgi:hypothetical protein
MLLVLALLLAMAPSSGWAQRFEITPFAGYRFGGSLNNVSFEASGSPQVGELNFANNWDYGLIADIGVVPKIKVELLFDRSNSKLQTSEVLGSITLDTVTIDYYHAGIVYQFESRVEPFFAITMGATNFIPKDRGSELRYSFGVAGGGKTYFNRTLGLRFEGRVFLTYLGGTDEYFCTEGNDCFRIPEGTVMPQFELNAGLIVRF